MADATYIDSSIDRLLDYLASIQHADGSFDTMYLQPYFHPDAGWMKFPEDATVDTAVALLPLLMTGSNKAQRIVENGKRFLLGNNLAGKMWAYAVLSEKYLVFYDTESTSLCSYVLERSGYDAGNKRLLDEFICGTDYRLYMLPRKYTRELSLAVQLKLYFHNRKVKRCLSVKYDAISLDDHEFSVTCNNLLYIRKTEKNQPVWEAVKENFRSGKISHLYYPTLFQSVYCYARLCGYGGYPELIPDDVVLDSYTSRLYEMLMGDALPMKRILLMNSLLFLHADLEKHAQLLEDCFRDLEAKAYAESTPFYSSSLEKDFQPDTREPHTYFGSPAITCALYIEFLNLYRKKQYGSYFKQEDI